MKKDELHIELDNLLAKNENRAIIGMNVDCSVPSSIFYLIVYLFIYTYKTDFSAIILIFVTFCNKNNSVKRLQYFHIAIVDTYMIYAIFNNKKIMF